MGPTILYLEPLCPSSFPSWLDSLPSFRHGSVMEAPLCLKCGTKHWSTQPCPADSSSPALNDAVEYVRKVVRSSGKKAVSQNTSVSPVRSGGKASLARSSVTTATSPGSVSVKEPSPPSAPPVEESTSGGPISAARASSDYRERIRADPVKHAAYLEKERERKRK